MTTFLQNKDGDFEVDVRKMASRLLSAPIVSYNRIGGGLNNRVYRLVGDDDSQYILKFYHRHRSDHQDRLKTEYSSLKFLSEHGFKSIAQPITIDENHGCAVYEYIEGDKILTGEITDSDIAQAIDFCGQLRNVKGAFPKASEAFFSVEAINENICSRIKRLNEAKGVSTEYGELAHYLSNDFIPFLDVLTNWAQDQYQAAGLSYQNDISEAERILSPSDFGFHNALRDKSGKIIFLDFEHFGWDDPAKLISDFLLHPAMTLHKDLKQQFASGILSLFEEQVYLKRRVEILYPFFGLKWCLIFLNEFHPEGFRRRDFARMDEASKQSILQEQLAKAQRMLKEIKQTYKKFPYSLSK